MNDLNVLLVQADLAWADPAANRQHLAKLLANPVGSFDLAVLPETFSTGFLGDEGLADEGMDGPTLDWMKRQAARYGCAVAGSTVIAQQGRRFNRFFFVTPEGEVQHYDKKHLFTYGGEDNRYCAGDQRVVVNYRGWRILLQVCYDLRFPAWQRLNDDYDLMLLVANWPAKRVTHWSTLLQARAIENQAWVVAVNRVGEDGNGVVYPGASVVVDPLGEKIAELGEAEEVRTVSAKHDVVQQVRQELPFQQDADRFDMIG